MADEAHLATGVGAAMLIDTLLGLGIDDPLALTKDEQVKAIEQAASEGRVNAALLTALRDDGARRNTTPDLLGRHSRALAHASGFACRVCVMPRHPRAHGAATGSGAASLGTKTPSSSPKNGPLVLTK